MKILLLNSILYTAEKNVIPQVDSIKDCMIYNLALGFKELGHDVTLVAASEYKPVRDEEYDFDVVFIPSVLKKFFPPAVLPFQPGLWHWLKREKKHYDFVISSEVFSFHSLFAAMHCSDKLMIWHESTGLQKKMKQIPAWIWHNMIARFFLRKIPILTRSEDAKRFILKYLSHVSDVVIEHGVNLTRFNYSREKKDQFIVVGQLIPRKNIPGILHKFTGLTENPKYSHFQLVIAGRGEMESDLKNQVRESGLEKNVAFVGHLPHVELNRRIAESLAMLVDTKKDLNMVSIPESIVSGTPVITNRLPTTSLFISRNHAGIAKDDWDETDLMEIIENNAVYVEHCIALREQLSAKHSAQQFLDFYTGCRGEG